MSEDPDAVVAHRPDRCACCGGGLHGDLRAEVVSLSERIELPDVVPVVTQHQRLAVQPDNQDGDGATIKMRH